KKDEFIKSLNKGVYDNQAQTSHLREAEEARDAAGFNGTVADCIRDLKTDNDFKDERIATLERLLDNCKDQRQAARENAELWRKEAFKRRDEHEALRKAHEELADNYGKMGLTLTEERKQHRRTVETLETR